MMLYIGADHPHGSFLFGPFCEPIRIGERPYLDVSIVEEVKSMRRRERGSS
jgi:hypothetical protein